MAATFEATFLELYFTGTLADSLWEDLQNAARHDVMRSHILELLGCLPSDALKYSASSKLHLVREFKKALLVQKW